MTSLTGVRPSHAFDEAALGRYLADQLPKLVKLPLTVQQFAFGQSNPTFLIIGADGVKLVMRKKPPGTKSKGAHAIEREFKVISALYGSSVPVPTPYLLCEDASLIGTPFYIMEYVTGRIFTDSTMTGVPRSTFIACVRDALRVLGNLHAVDVSSVGLSTFGGSGQYFNRQLSSLTKAAQLQEQAVEPIPGLETLTAWMAAHLPPEEPPCIIHGDYKIDNLVFHPTEPRVIAVLDWELSTIGHRMADVANISHYMFPLSQLADLFTGAMTGTAPAAPGSPGTDSGPCALASADDVKRMYCEQTGYPVAASLSPFFPVYFHMKSCVILHGIAARAAAGVASSPHAHMLGALVPLLSQAALECIPPTPKM